MVFFPLSANFSRLVPTLDETGAALHPQPAIAIATIMKNLISSRLWCIPALALSLVLGHSQSFSFQFDDPAIWDLRGPMTLSQEIEGATGAPLPLVFGFELDHDASGRLTSAGNTIVTVGQDTVAADCTVRGKVSGGSTSPTKVSLSVRLRGEGVIAGLSTKFSGSLNYALTVNPETGALEGTVRGSFHSDEAGGGKVSSFVTVPLASAQNGKWRAALTVSGLNPPNGTGSLTLSSQRVLNGEVRGSYSKSSGVARAKLTGTNEDKGSKVQFDIVTLESGSFVTGLNGVVLGQRVR